MKIIAIASAPALGGAELFLFRVSGELSRRQIPVTLAVADGAATVGGPWETLAGPKTPNALRRRGLGSIAILRHPAWERWRGVLTRARREGADVLVLQYPAEQAALTGIARKQGYRVVWIVHSRLPFVLARWLLGRHLKRLAPSADAIFVISQSTRRALAAAGWPARIMHAITPCVEAEPERRSAGHGETRLIVLSRLTRRKGVQVVLRAAARLRAEFPDLKVAVAGEGRYSSSLRRLAGRLRIGPAVEFLGFVPDPRALLASGGIVVQATYDRGDSIPTVLLEAGLAGLPVVTTDWNGAAEVVDDGVNGLLVAPKSVASLAGALGPLLRDPDRRAAMGRRGRDRVLCNYTVSQVTDKILDALPLSSRR